MGKYWDSESYDENLPQNDSSIFSNYFNYGQDIDTSNTSTYFDSYFNLGKGSGYDSDYDSILSDIKNLSKGSTSDKKQLESLYNQAIDCVGNLIANTILESLGINTYTPSTGSGSSSYFSSYFNLGQNVGASSGSSSYFDSYFNLGQNINTSGTSSYFDSYFNLDF